MKHLLDAILIILIWCACVATVGFFAGLTYGIGKPFFNFAASLVGA